MKARFTDITMNYEVIGSGRPILFLHGYPLSQEIWKPQRQGLSSNFMVITPDLRGHGKTTASPGIYSMELLAMDCAALIDAIGLTKPITICGLSMGGYVSFAFHRLFPHKVKSLVLTATRSGADSEEMKINRERSELLAREAGAFAIAESMASKLFSPNTYETNPEIVDSVKKIMARTSVEGIVGTLQGMRQRVDSTPYLASITVPTLIIHGNNDQLIPLTEAQIMQKAIPNSKLTLIPDAGHLPNLEQPEKFNQVIRDFMESTEIY
jgi:pimeloyl-ACP methyl ester carboxylesterase